jgi:putative heme-binding domain-containing protein
VAGLELMRQRQQDHAEAIAQFREPGTLNRHARAVLALSSGESSRLWSDGGLLLLAEEQAKNRKGNGLAEAEVALLNAWSRPARRLPLLRAAEFFNTRTQEAIIREGLADSDPEVLAHARKLADVWKITAAAPTGPKLSTMKPEEVIAAVLKMSGDAARGEGVFAKLSCNKCHTVKPDEPIRGPYLPNVAKTYKREQLAESILLPSKTLAQGFVTNIFILNDGKSLVGFVTNEAADEVTIRNAEGNEIKIKVEDIDERAKQPISVMPEGLAKDITLDDFAALIAYLESLASRATK